jgi:catechol 2,3-dioxygenase-like lactoylglutathione lyase family enzyme
MKKLLLTGIFLSSLGWAQQRPRLVGLSHIAVRVKDLNAARHFYGDLLGYQEAITIRKDNSAMVGGGLKQDQVQAVFFKVNNRQYIVVMPETTADQPRYVGAAIETDNAEGMRAYLKSMGFSVPDKVDKTPTFDLAFHVQDPDGNLYEIMQYTPESLSVQTFGKFLSDDRASTRILHVGISITKQQSADFYLKAFSLREFWRADPTMTAPGRPRAESTGGPVLANLSNLKLPEADDYIEWSLQHARPTGVAAANNANAAAGRAAGDRVLVGHIALIVPDMAKAVEFVKAKPAWKDYTRAAQQESHVGVNHKWQGNFFDPDGTRSEFMEADTADGLPSPMSHAPYYQ